MPPIHLQLCCCRCDAAKIVRRSEQPSRIKAIAQQQVDSFERCHILPRIAFAVDKRRNTIMTRARISPFSFAALLSLIWMTSAVAQNLAPQPFAAPPRLVEKGKAAPLALPGAPAGCTPDAEITQVVGNLVTLHIEAKMAPNQIRDPGTPNGMDTVQLRSYGGCLTGPVIEAKPGSTVRILLHNGLDANDPTCPPPPDMQKNNPGVECFNTINMHFHGLHVSPSGNSDNVLLNTPPQTKLEYQGNIPCNHP